MVKKLNTYGFPQHEIQEAIDRCMDSGYLNDERIAHTYLLELQDKGYGINGIKHKLYAKAIPKEIVSACIAARCTDDNEIRVCQRALVKKLRYLKGKEPLGDLRPKLQRFLFGRGFSSHIIYQAMDEAIAENK